MPHFQRDAKAAKKQESDWRSLVKYAHRLVTYVSRPCVYCGVMMTPSTVLTQGMGTNETRDHITPKCKGGTITVACCEECNRDKHHLTIDEWRCVLMWRKRRPIVFHYERENAQILVRNLWSLLARMLA